MTQPGKYGTPPYTVAVIHGGPGATGEMAPVARRLSSSFGVLEPLQDASSIEGLVGQLKSDIENNSKGPVSLIGHSWGAWLGYIFSAKHPEMVKKLILVGSGPFEDQYAPSILKTRLSRLDDTEKILFNRYLSGLGDPSDTDETFDIEPFKLLLKKTDAYDPIDETDDEGPGPFVQESYWQIWDEAERLRKSGELLHMGRFIRCPVIAIHGDHDPHPAEGVVKPLSSALRNFKPVILEKCGHDPWREKQAKEKFYGILERELA